VEFVRARSHLAAPAASALVRIRSAESELAVRRLIDREEGARVRDTVLRALGWHGDFSAELLLRAIAFDEGDGAAWTAKEALAQLTRRRDGGGAGEPL
jgi:hypothetical protein